MKNVKLNHLWGHVWADFDIIFMIMLWGLVWSDFNLLFLIMLWTLVWAYVDILYSNQFWSLPVWAYFNLLYSDYVLRTCLSLFWFAIFWSILIILWFFGNPVKSKFEIISFHFLFMKFISVSNKHVIICFSYEKLF